MSDQATDAIRDMVNAETDAWNRQDADALVTLFHPDMVWPWPPSNRMHDPLTWTTGMAYNATSGSATGNACSMRTSCS